MHVPGLRETIDFRGNDERALMAEDRVSLNAA
jgi:hypothetical protein